MVLTTPMVLTKTHGIESVLLNHTHKRGPSVTRMRNFFGDLKHKISLDFHLDFLKIPHTGDKESLDQNE